MKHVIAFSREHIECFYIMMVMALDQVGEIRSTPLLDGKMSISSDESFHTPFEL